MKKIALFFSALLFSMMSFAGVVTFDADNDKGNAGTDSNNAAAYTITKSGVTVEVSSGILGTYNNETHYRVYKNQTLTITSTVGNITSVEFTCTANDDAKYGPGCFTVAAGAYAYSGPVGTWTGSESTITFTATTNQVRATQVVVTVDGEVGETPEQPEEPETPDTPETPETPAGVITCAEALAICLETGETSTTETYTIRGYVTEIKDAYNEQYGNITYWMADAVDGGQVLLAYRVKPSKAGEEKVNVGDYVEVVGTLVNYKGNTPEVNAGGTYTILTGGETPDTPDTPATGTEIKNLNYADAIYVNDPEYGDYWVFDMYNDYDYDAEDYVYPDLYVMVNEIHSKTAINGTYNVLYTEYMLSADEVITTDESAEDFVGTLTIKNVDNEGNYSFKGSFTAADGKTYTYDQVVNVYAYAYSEVDGEPMYEDIELNESGTTPENPDPENPENPETPAGEVTFDADVDKGNASEDATNQTEYTVEKEGVTMVVSKGIIGVYNNENHYRIYKSETLTITSTVGNIVSVEFTCTANDDVKYGPGCFTVDGGDYTYSGPVGTWTGSATEVVFTATTNQVRATQVVVKIAGAATDVEDIITVELPVKVLNNGQLMIISGENMYNILGTQIK